MKYLLAVLILYTLSMSSCNWEDYGNTEEEDFNDKMSVDEYITQLSDNSYEQVYIPAFTPDDIPALLRIGSSKIVIENFPRNPISSYYQKESKLGFVALWTIESIRKSYNIKDIEKFDRYPSQNAVPIMKDTGGFTINESDSVLDIFAKSYQAWWDKMEYSDFNYMRFIDPLEGSEFRWK